MKYSICVLGLLLLKITATAQYYDSLSLVSADWHVEKLAKNIKLKQYHFYNKNLFQANENISYVEIKNNGKYEFDMAAEPKQLKTVTEFVKSKNAIAAVNGNFFDVKNGGAVDFTRVDGVVINTNRKGKDEKLSFNQKAAVVISNRRVNIKKWDGLVNWEEWLKEPDVMLNGPLLMLNKVNEHPDTTEFYTARHPRTCVGITKKNKVILLVVDGRNTHSAGMTLAELTKIMRWLGCVSAINFDGGGSSTLWIKDKGVINYPADNKKWDHEGERKVANILYIRKRQRKN
ncbi:MAG: phosphodiester glycosidase family protein [Niabella sp.]